MVATLMAGLTDDLVAEVQKALSGKAGPRRSAFAKLDEASLVFSASDPRVFLSKVAVIAIRDAVGAAAYRRNGKGMLTLSAGTQIGNDIADEILAERFQDIAPALLSAVTKNAKKRGASPRHVAAAVRKADVKFALGCLPPWSETDRRDVGCAVLEVLANRGDIVVLIRGSGKRDPYVVEWADDAAQWFASWNAAAISIGVKYLPMVEPPLPWTGLRSGGYRGGDIRPLSFVKHMRKAQRDVLATADLSSVYSAVNAIQATPWRINGDVLAVANEFWRRGIVAAGLPSREPEAIPEASDDVRKDVSGGDKRKRHRTLANEAHSRNRMSMSLRMAVETTLGLASKFGKRPAIYFPHNVDYRGRAYAVPQALTLQGKDLHRGLLHFANAKPLGDDGAYWLAIHGANVFGHDKLPFADRVAWAYAADTQRIVHDVAADAITNRNQWIDADKPWQFLAWCIEWSAFLASGESDDFVSSIPVALDGTCNGLQHLAAIARDAATGAAVNLTPSDTPQDVYQRVSDYVVAALKADDDNWIAGEWLAFGVNRALMKPIVMTLPYGSTAHGRRKALTDAIAERTTEGGCNQFGHDVFKAVAYLMSVVDAAIRQCISGVDDTTAWLQGAARAVASGGNVVSWAVPSGFVVVNDVRRPVKGGHVALHYGSSKRGIRLRLQNHSDTQDTAAHVRKIVADVVHSHDAAHMMATVNTCVENGIGSFAMIHDSYATHAADTAAMARHLRSAFVGLYADRDMLAELRMGLIGGDRLPVTPEIGNLNIGQVTTSDYFFA